MSKLTCKREPAIARRRDPHHEERRHGWSAGRGETLAQGASAPGQITIMPRMSWYSGASIGETRGVVISFLAINLRSWLSYRRNSQSDTGLSAGWGRAAINE